MNKLVLTAMFALLATAPTAMATPTVFYPGTYTILGHATACFTAITPIGPGPALVLQNFVGTINSISYSFAWLAILPPAGVFCVPDGSGGFWVFGTFTGVAVGGP
jgi:hypothetical protein